jgi:hypothetical protein
MTVIPSGAALGADIQNVDLKALSAGDYEAINRDSSDHHDDR